MIKDGEVYTGDKKGNIGGNTQPNFMKWLAQCADYTETLNKILIENIKNVSSINHQTQKPLYKPYIETLFYDFLNKEYKTSFINQLTISKYDKKLKDYFFDNYEINYYPFFSYVMKCLRNSVIQNIDTAIDNVSVFGINKKYIYTLNGKPLTEEQHEFIKDKYITNIRYNNVLKGIKYSQDLTGEINKQLKKLNFRSKKHVSNPVKSIKIGNKKGKILVKMV